MLYELENGTTVMIPDEIFFKLTDEEFKDFISNANGFEIQNPFYNSALENTVIEIDEVDDILENIEELDENFYESDD